MQQAVWVNSESWPANESRPYLQQDKQKEADKDGYQKVDRVSTNDTLGTMMCLTGSALYHPPPPPPPPMLEPPPKLEAAAMATAALSLQESADEEEEEYRTEVVE